MRYHPQGESIWGNINTAIEIALNVYYVFAEDGEGIMIPKDKAGGTVSPKTAEQGKEDNGYLCYGKNENMNLPMNEILQKRIAACEKIKAQAIAQMQEINRSGRPLLTDCFGQCDPPAATSGNVDGQLDKVRNGIYFISDGGQTYFAIHEFVANSFLSPMAFEFGRQSGSYLLYEPDASAIPLHELRKIYGEVDSLIVSEDSLYATLNQNYRSYVSMYNEIAGEESKIPAVEAPASLFLQRQLDGALENIEAGEQGMESEFAFEPDADYGFEP